MGAQRKAPKFLSFITCTVRPLQFGASVPVSVAASERKCGREGGSTAPTDGGGMEEALSPAGAGVLKMT